MILVKKEKVYVISFIVGLIVLLLGNACIANAATTGTTATGLKYEISEGSVKITDYTGKAKNVSIPATINGYNVTQIGRYAFSNCSTVTSVFIPSSVTYIGNGAFENCVSLQTINIPVNVTQIGEDPFYGVFDGCIKLTKITVDSKNNYYSSYDGILFNKDKSILIRCPEGRTGTYNMLSGVKTINLYAFRNCSNLTKINIATSVKLIKHRAFYGCEGLITIDIPSGVTEIEGCAFEYCDNLKVINISSGLATIENSTFDECSALKEINVSKDNKYFSSISGVLFNKDKTVLVRCPQGKKGSYTVPSGVKTIGKFAFAMCEDITKVQLPSGIDSINNYAFDLCYGLEEINFPSGLKSIGEFVFYNCEKIDYFYIPCTVKSIGKETFCYYSFPTIYCDMGSYAEKYAIENEISYKSAKKGCYLGNGKFTATISQPSFTYTGDYIKPIVTVKGTVNGKSVTLTNWKDYKVTYKNFRAPGTATITVTGRGDYVGELQLTFTIKPFDISKLKATIVQKSFGYTGDYIKPVVTVKGLVGGKTVTLTNWKDYKVTYKNFKNPGTATITITGRGNYTGTLTLTFTIRK